jgi:hypothetical protein
MEKTGEVRKGRTPCSFCSRKATVVDGKTALCSVCAATKEKRAAKELPLRSFTEPIEE